MDKPDISSESLSKQYLMLSNVPDENGEVTGSRLLALPTELRVQILSYLLATPALLADKPKILDRRKEGRWDEPDCDVCGGPDWEESGMCGFCDEEWCDLCDSTPCCCSGMEEEEATMTDDSHHLSSTSATEKRGGEMSTTQHLSQSNDPEMVKANLWVSRKEYHLDTAVLRTCKKLYMDGKDLLLRNKTVVVSYYLTPDDIDSLDTYVLGEASLQAAMTKYPGLKKIEMWQVDLYLEGSELDDGYEQDESGWSVSVPDPTKYYGFLSRPLDMEKWSLRLMDDVRQLKLVEKLSDFTLNAIELTEELWAAPVSDLHPSWSHLITPFRSLRSQSCRTTQYTQHVPRILISAMNDISSDRFFIKELPDMRYRVLGIIDTLLLSTLKSPLRYVVNPEEEEYEGELGDFDGFDDGLYQWYKDIPAAFKSTFKCLPPCPVTDEDTFKLEELRDALLCWDIDLARDTGSAIFARLRGYLTKVDADLKAGTRTANTKPTSQVDSKDQELQEVAPKRRQGKVPRWKKKYDDGDVDKQRAWIAILRSELDQCATDFGLNTEARSEDSNSAAK